MPRAKRGPSPLDAAQPACGSCRFWHRNPGEAHGDCHANPPSVHYDVEGDYTQALRPTTDDTDPPCRHWTPRN